MKPIVKEFEEVNLLRDEVSRLSEMGITKKDLYILSHDDNLSKKIANEADAKQLSAKEDSLGSKIVNIPRGKDEEIHHRFVELGFSQDQADTFEKKLAAGKLLLLIGDHKDTRGT